MPEGVKARARYPQQLEQGLEVSLDYFWAFIGVPRRVANNNPLGFGRQVFRNCFSLIASTSGIGKNRMLESLFGVCNS